MAGVKGRSGTKPKPNKEKQLTKSRHANPNPVDFETIKNVEPPEWLEPLAKEMWLTVCPHLCKKKVLAVTDLHNLEIFCTEYATWRAANQHVKDNGIVMEGATGGPIKNPARTVATEAMRQMATFGGNLGLDPASRSRLIGPAGPETSNPFGKF
jgi:P27 family predicted phage terminase small subunit